MTKEEKARRYDEAIKVIKDNLDALNEITETGAEVVNIQSIKNCFYKAFPELKKSEDERIRNWLIGYFHQYKDDGMEKYANGLKVESILAWLEKQGDQKSINELTPQEAMDVAVAKCFKKFEQNLTNEMISAEESLGISSEEYNKIVDDCIFGEDKPKFKAGDWVVYNNDICQIVKREEGCNKLVTTFGIEKELVNERNLSTARLWTIEDAKDGDVLSFKDGTSGTLIYKESTSNFGVISYCRIVRNNFIDKEENGWGSTLLSPAIKEQRNLLFQKMHEAGYMWDSESKQLLSLKAEPSGEQKPAWLENQDKQKSTDNVEPKFYEGDWVVTDKNNVVQIKTIENGKYVLENTMRFSVDYVDKCWRKWNISDAKDGDVIVNGKMIVIFKHFEEQSYRHHIVAYIGLDTTGNIQITDDIWNLGIDKSKLATKEQRDLLFQKMHEAGYEWDDEKKELKKFDFSKPIKYNSNPPSIDKKSDWSEEDDELITAAICFIDSYNHDNGFACNGIYKDDVSKWILSLKERIIE